MFFINGIALLSDELIKANILVDEAGHACLTDFGLLTILSDPTNGLSSSSCVQGGTFRWMSPELIDPGESGLEKSRPTMASDCYALGMVIYETVSGNIPFHENRDVAIFAKVARGERPTRGTEFPDRLWKMMESCWAPEAKDRPSIEDVLQCLQMVSISKSPHDAGYPKPVWSTTLGNLA
jgi:serine/threonine protein kinase